MDDLVGIVNLRPGPKLDLGVPALPIGVASRFPAALLLTRGVTTDMRLLAATYAATVGRRQPAVGTPTIPPVRTADYRLSGEPRIRIDPGWLRDAYVVEGRSCADIGREMGASPNTIDRRLHALGIPVRTPGEVGARRDPLVVPRDVLTRKFLSDALGRKKLSLKQIARQTGFSVQTVSRYAHRYGIPIPAWALHIARRHLATLVGRGLPIYQIAPELGCSHTTVERRLAAFGLLGRRRTLEIDERELRRMIGAGWTLKQMATSDAAKPPSKDGSSVSGCGPPAPGGNRFDRTAVRGRRGGHRPSII